MKAFSLLLVMVVASPSAFAQSASDTVAYVDIARVFADSRAGKEVARALGGELAKQQSEASMRAPVQRKIDEAVRAMADELGYAFVFDKAGTGLVYLSSSLDLTEEVIRRVDGERAMRGSGLAKPLPGTIASLDVQRVLNSLDEGTAARARLTKKRNSMQREIDAEQKAIKDDLARLEARTGLTSEQRKLQRELIDRRILRLKETHHKSQKELNDEEQAALKAIFARVDASLATIAPRKGIALVFELKDSGWILETPSLDITPDVLQHLQAGNGPASTYAPPGPTRLGYIDAVAAATKHWGDGTARTLSRDEVNARLRPMVDVEAKRRRLAVIVDREAAGLLVASPERDLARTPPSASAAEPATRHPLSGADEELIAPVTRMRQDDAFAIVVGVERYRGDLPPADYAENDAQAFARYLVRTLGVPKQNVKLLVGERASRSDIESALKEWLPGTSAKKGGNVYFFFSGHGTPDPETGTAYLIPYDGDPTYLKTKALQLSDVYASLGALPGRNVLAFIDACFSGTGHRSVLAKGLRPLVPVREPAPTKGVMAVMTSASGAQVSGPSPGLRHGAFTARLLEGLSGRADRDGDGAVTLHELHLYVKRLVAADAVKSNRAQTPQLQLHGTSKAGEWAVVEGLVED